MAVNKLIKHRHKELFKEHYLLGHRILGRLRVNKDQQKFQNNTNLCLISLKNMRYTLNKHFLAFLVFLMRWLSILRYCSNNKETIKTYRSNSKNCNRIAMHLIKIMSVAFSRKCLLSSKKLKELRSESSKTELRDILWNWKKLFCKHWVLCKEENSSWITIVKNLWKFRNSSS